MDNKQDPLERLQKLAEIANQDYATPQEVADIVKVLVNLIEASKVANLDEISRIRKETTSVLQDITDRIEARVAQVKDGKDGKDGKKGDKPVEGVDYFIPNPVPGPPGPPGTPGTDGSPDSPDQVVEKVNTSTVLIKKERIDGLVEALSQMVGGAVGVTTTFFLKNGTTIGRAKNINFVEGNNITITEYQTGDQMNISISSSGGGAGATWVDSEVPSGSGTDFTLANTPVSGTVKVYRGGARQQVTVDYTLSGAEITLTNALGTGEVLVVDYGY